MTNETATENPAGKVWNLRGLYCACGLLTLIILLLDLAIPLGVAMGVAYVVVVLLSLWSPTNKLTLLVAVACSVLIVSAFFIKPAVAEMWKVIFNRGIALFAVWLTAILGLQRKASERKREITLQERERALADVRVLQGLLPICASCKRIRDDQGYWVQIEGYIRDHSEAEFSHGICQDCAKKLYPEYYDKIQQKQQASTSVAPVQSKGL